jgi:ABC-type Zn2+ transport system substrate-binding protein/surface adhesin
VVKVATILRNLAIFARGQVIFGGNATYLTKTSDARRLQWSSTILWIGKRTNL